MNAIATRHKKPNESRRNQEPASLPATGFIRAAQLIKFIPFSRTSIWRKVKSGQFPKPVKLSDNITAWKAEDVHEWIEERGKSKEKEAKNTTGNPPPGLAESRNKPGR
jgi:predicted DNA-binding transcriptional regulator AlpA